EPGLPAQKYDFHLGMLSLSYQTRAMIFIAQGQSSKAIDGIRASVETTCKLYERWEAGIGRELEAGTFQRVLLSFTKRDNDLISSIVGNYLFDKGSAGSIYLEKALKLVAINDFEGAKIALAQKKPRFEPQFLGYAECLEAVTNLDEQRF